MMDRVTRVARGRSRRGDFRFRPVRCAAGCAPRSAWRGVGVGGGIRARRAARCCSAAPRSSPARAGAARAAARRRRCSASPACWRCARRRAGARADAVARLSASGCPASATISGRRWSSSASCPSSTRISCSRRPGARARERVAERLRAFEPRALVRVRRFASALAARCCVGCAGDAGASSGRRAFRAAGRRSRRRSRRWRPRRSRSSATSIWSCTIPRTRGCRRARSRASRGRCWRCRARASRSRRARWCRHARGALLVEAKTPRRSELPGRRPTGGCARSRCARAAPSASFSAAARRLREPDAHRIDIEPDRAPRVDLYAPADPLEVAGPRRIELAYSIDDDYGLGDIELVWQVSDGPRQRRSIEAKPQAGDARAAGQVRVGPRRARSQAGRARRLSPRGQGQRHGAGANVGRSQHLQSVDVQPAREARDAGRRRGAAARGGGAAAGRSAGGASASRRTSECSPIHAITRPRRCCCSLAEAEQAAGERRSRDGARTSRSSWARSTRGWPSWCATKRRSWRVRARRKAKPLRGAGGGSSNLNRGTWPSSSATSSLLDDLLGKQRLEELLPSATRWRQTRDRLKQLLAQYKKTRSEALKKEIEREMRELERKLAELQKAPAAGVGASRSVPQPRGDGQERSGEAARQDDADAGQGRRRQRDGRAGEAVVVAGQDDGVDGGAICGVPAASDLPTRRRRWPSWRTSSPTSSTTRSSCRARPRRCAQRTRAEAQRQMRDKIEPFQKRAREKVAQLKKHLGDVDPPRCRCGSRRSCGG